MKNSKKRLPYKEAESIKTHGKVRYRKRKIEEKDSEVQLKEFKHGNKQI